MGWLSGYLHRKPIPLTGGADGSQVDFQLLLSIAYDSDMLADFSDLRFTKEDGETLIDAWLEDKTDGTSADVYVEFLSTPASGIKQTKGYVYYGKADAVNYWDIGETFVVGDGFEGYTDGSNLDGQGGWTAAGSGTEHVISTDVARSGVNSAKGAANDKTDYHSCPLTDTGVIMVFLRQPATSDLGYVYIGDSGGVGDLIISLFNDGHVKYYDSGSNWANLPTDTTYNANEWYKLEFAYDATNNKYPFIKVNGVTKGTDVASVAISSAAYLGIRTYTATSYFDDVCIRKYAANPPTYEFGSEENVSSGLTILDFERAGMRGAFRGIGRGIA